MKKKIFLAKIISLITVCFLFAPTCFCYTNKDTYSACNQAINNIFEDIQNLKREFEELQNFSINSKKENETYGTYNIMYSNDFELGPKSSTPTTGDKPLSLTIAIGPVDWISTWQHAVFRFRKNFDKINTGILVIIHTENKKLEDEIIEVIKHHIKPLELMNE